MVEDQSETSMVYINLPDQLARELASKSYADEDRACIPAVSGRKLYRLVGVSFGLLCIFQAALNIFLHLSPHSSVNKTSGIEASCKNLTEQSDDPRHKLTNFDHHFQEGWVYFHSGFYYISSTKKSWQDSRDDCLQRGADLVVINNREEQDFASKLQKARWIGLTDRETDGVWKWVDGTQLTESYWGPGEPNDQGSKNEDCAEIRYHDKENNWNDIPCGDQNFWICEKTVAL